jgi:hypothetical protein
LVEIVSGNNSTTIFRILIDTTAPSSRVGKERGAAAQMRKRTASRKEKSNGHSSDGSLVDMESSYETRSKFNPPHENWSSHTHDYPAQ